MLVSTQPSGDLISMHRVVLRSDGATTSSSVVKSIHHLLKASPITHVGFVTNLVQGPTLEIVYYVKYLCRCRKRAQRRSV